MGIAILIIGAGHAGICDAYAERHPRGSLYHLWGGTVIERTYGHKEYHLMALRMGKDKSLKKILPGNKIRRKKPKYDLRYLEQEEMGIGHDF